MKIIFPSHATIPFKIFILFSVNKRKAEGGGGDIQCEN